KRNKMTITDIEMMNFRERLQAMELLWYYFLKDESKIDSPAWHEEILQNRKARIDSGESKFISLDELKANRK
ncbi:addiction module protein, partial [candidate division KSB1 bacterium]|nr:addiction module protein [candidate division KSB1 bacterium]